MIDRGSRLDPGYETVPGKRRGATPNSYGPRSFPPADYECVQPREPGYETLPEVRREEQQYHSLEPGYETLPEVEAQYSRGVEAQYSGGVETQYSRGLEAQYSRGVEAQYSRVNKKGPRAAPPQPSPPRPRLYSGSELNYETLPEPRNARRLAGSDEGGYETIPASQRRDGRLGQYDQRDSRLGQYDQREARLGQYDQRDSRLGQYDQRDGRLGQYDPGYETLPAVRLPPSEPGYETIPGAREEMEDLASEAATTDPDYARLKDADIEFIDESADELDDELGRLHTDEDVTVESSGNSSLIHMSVVESGTGVRRSSVVMIEHVDMTPVPSRASDGGSDMDMDVNTHIFV